MNNDYNDIKEKVEQIFKDIAEESLSLEDVDLGSILKEWKDLCQTLDSKTYHEIPDNEDNILQTGSEDSFFIHENQDESKKEETLSNDAQNKNLPDLELVEDDGKEALNSDLKADSENSLSIESEDQINSGLQKPDWLETTNVDEALSTIVEEDNSDDEFIIIDIPNVHNTGFLFDSPVSYTWEMFERDICCNDLLLIEKCKSFCSKLEENIDITEANLWILNKIKNLQNQAKQIINDNPLVFSGANTMVLIEQRMNFGNEIARHYREMKDILVLIRKTFPENESTMRAIENDNIEGNESSEDEYIENRPVPNFWP